MVGVAKKILKKAKESKQDPYLLILEYRNGPLPVCNLSPAQLLLSRRTRSVVPITNNLLKPQAIDPKVVQKQIFRSKSLQKRYYDRSAKALPPLRVHDQVRIQFGKLWKPARVIQQYDARSFSVQIRDGAIYCRNRRHLIKTQNGMANVEGFNPNILAQPENSTSISPDVPAPAAPQNNLSNNTSHGPPNMPYITRSGREVKTSKRYDDGNWITN